MTSDVSRERRAGHAQCVHRMNPSSGGRPQQLQRVPFEFPVGREFTAEPIKGFRIGHHVVPQLLIAVCAATTPSSPGL